MRKGLIALLFGLILTSSTSAQLQGRLYLDKESYLVGEPVYLYFDLTNQGAEPLEIIIGNSYSLCGGYQIEVSSDPSTEFSSCSPVGFAGSCAAGGRIIAPGETYRDKVLLNYEHSLTKPQTYDIRASRTLHYGFPGAALESRNFGVQIKAEALFHIRIGDASDESLAPIFQPYLADLNSKDSERQSEAARVIGSLAPSFLEATILSMLDSPVTRPFAIMGLRHLNTPRSREALASIVQTTSGYSYEKDQAIKYLSEMGDRTYFPLLLGEAMRHEPNQARDYVLAAAELGGEEAMPYVVSLVISPDPFSRANGVMALPLTDSRTAVPILIDLLRNQDIDLERLASIGLIRLTHLSPLGENRWFSDKPADDNPEWWNWWLSNGASAPIYGPSQCGKVESLNKH